MDARESREAGNTSWRRAGSIVALAISLVSGLASVTVVLAIAAFYAITGSHGD